MSVFVLLLLLLLLQSPLSHLFYQWSKPQLQQTCSNCSLNRFQFQLFSKFRTKFHLKLAEAGCWLGPGTAEWRWLQWKHQNVPETDNNMKLVWIYGTMEYKYQISILCWREGGLVVAGSIQYSCHFGIYEKYIDKCENISLFRLTRQI